MDCTYEARDIDGEIIFYRRIKDSDDPLTMLNTENDILNEGKETLSGGLSDNMTLKDIAERHGINFDYLTRQYVEGIKVELEHTDNINVAKEIARDHLYESPHYYSALRIMERKIRTLEKGGQSNGQELDEEVEKIREVLSGIAKGNARKIEYRGRTPVGNPVFRVHFKGNFSLAAAELFTKNFTEMSVIKGIDPIENVFKIAKVQPSYMDIEYTEPDKKERGGETDSSLPTEKEMIEEMYRRFPDENSARSIWNRRGFADAYHWIEGHTRTRGAEMEVGGIVDGKAHAECDETGCGETFHVRSTQKDVELEGGELVINKTNAADEDEYEVKGTPKEIASAINAIDGHGIDFEQGAEIEKIKDNE